MYRSAVRLLVITKKISWCWQTRGMRLEISQGHQTWYHSICLVCFLLVWNSNCVFKTCRFSDIRLQKCHNLEIWVRGYSRSSKSKSSAPDMWPMSHIVNSCPLTKFDQVCLLRLHEADEAAVDWLTTYGWLLAHANNNNWNWSVA